MTARVHGQNTELRQGQLVLITSRAHDGEGGWRNSWSEREMTPVVGTVGWLSSLGGANGHRVYTRRPGRPWDYYAYPDFVLTPVSERTFTQDEARALLEAR